MAQNSNFNRMFRKIILFLVAKGIFDFLEDEPYLKLVYWAELDKKLNLVSPNTFNEKLNWKKINDRKKNYTTMADKFEVKKYVSDRVGEQYLIPVYGIWNTFDEIDFAALPNEFVLKTTHDSGGVVICTNKAEFDLNQARKIINQHLKRNYFKWRREWPYKDIQPRIIAEKFVKDDNFENLPVYKFFCFHGVPKIVQSIQNDKQSNETIDYFDMEWNLLDLKQNFPNSKEPLEKPRKLEEMVELAATLSKDMDFIRVDLYIINEEIKFSEFTFYSDAGINAFTPESWDDTLGSWLSLPDK